MVEDLLLQGWQQLPINGKVCVINKSYKDVISLSTFIYEGDSIYGVAPLSETQTITQEQYEDLKSRFEYLFVMGDNDEEGREFMIRHNKLYNIPYLVFPYTMKKDFTDNVVDKGIIYMQELIDNL
jgi:hypothetical protein